MALKEDILEQIVEEYLIHQGYFVRHNVKFLPDKDHLEFNSKTDSNHSDIDVLAYNPRRTGPDRVWAVSCKSWQGGLNPARKIEEIQSNKISAGRQAWKGFRELTRPKWSEAFINAVRDQTGERMFTYVTAVTRLEGDRKLWENHPAFCSAMAGNPIRLITLGEMVSEIYGQTKTTMAVTDIGRTLQLFKAAGVKI